MSDESQYAQLGVDAHKGSVKKSFRGVIDNEHPMAFCNIAKDRLSPDYVLTQHMDGDGSKILQRLLHYRETGDATVFRGAVDDAWSMNTSDIAASGFVDELFITDVININGRFAPKEVIMEQFAIRIAELKELYAGFKINVTFFGGETADLPDQLRSIVFDICVSSRVHERYLIKGNVEPGDVIFGFASDGQAMWEEKDNSGIMSNGLTMARNKLMHRDYVKKYPYLARVDKPFTGRHHINSCCELFDGKNISQMIMSPTRQWALLIKMIIQQLSWLRSLHLLHGIVVNTGGGATKILNIGKNICYQKEMPTLPPIFELIQAESGESLRNMYTTFNCGIGIDVIGSPEGGILEGVLKQVSAWSDIKLYYLGECFHSENPNNMVVLSTTAGNFTF